MINELDELDEEALFSWWRREPESAPIAFAQLERGTFVPVTDPRLALEAATRLERAAQRLERAAAAARSAPASEAALLTIDEVAEALRCSTRQVRRLISTGRLAATRATERGSSRVLVERKDLDRYLRTLLRP